ncbi:MAG: 16S rRNA (cytosine(1402)-N(4))-methyltransferase RsmH [Endomicrobium sp.]|jgi:16S rRNA (cytosine1402-N4)-methyltransferase|nr:16S rRNA (cytosine(1402)-N(4))-methyltransferase RsmH [Endomicrobium sp.]
MYHIPVMPLEVSHYLINNPNGLYIDCTFGDGGHTLYLLNNFKNIKIVAFDWDEDVSKRLFKKENLNNRVIFIRENFKNIKRSLLKININKVDGILADLGVSTKQLSNLERGFSFNSSVLDMRMDNRNKLTAKEIVNSYSPEDLADIFYTYGEEYKSRQIAKAIVLRRKTMIINTAIELQKIIYSVKRTRSKKNPATKVFQALRIFINNELKNLETLLFDSHKLLNTGGRIAIISFHSLEDRIVKKNFKHNSDSKIYKIITKKIITPSKIEIKNNCKSRSAKMRVAEKIDV